MLEFDGGPRRILIIDDNRTIHSDYRKILTPPESSRALAAAEASFFGESTRPKGIHYEVDSAFQGMEGLELVSRSIENNRPYDLSFVDMRMPPGWDGVETIEHLWQVDPDLQIVICTAFSDYSWSETAQRLSESDKFLILKKPFDNSEVAQLAASLTTKRCLARQATLRMEELEALVDERTRTLQQAHQEAERLLAAISSLLVGVDSQGHVRRWNSTAERVFGLPSSEVVGKGFASLPIEWKDSKRMHELLALGPGHSESRLEIEFRDHRGDSRMLGLSVYPVGSIEAPSGLLFLGVDITEHRLLEQQLQQSQKLESVGQLAAGVAHEINTPMQYVGDNLDFLRNKIEKLSPLLEPVPEMLAISSRVPDLSERETRLFDDMQDCITTTKGSRILGQITEAIDDSRDGIQHVSRIVRAMKEFAHPGQEEKSPVDINRAIESTIAVTTNEWKYVADVTTCLDDSIPLVPAIAGELNQVFLNILVNAAHAIGDANKEGAGSKGTITVTTRGAGECVEVSIADTGTGIPDELTQRIFDPFFTTKEVGRGTGQGLAIAYAVVVQKHGGKLWCESTIGKGTTFFIHLNVCADHMIEESSTTEVTTMA